MARSHTGYKCKHCYEQLSESNSGPCPSCGKTGRIISASVEERIGFSDSVKSLTIREYYQKHPMAHAVSLIIAIGSPFLGLILGGWPGVLAGLGFSGLSYVIGPKAMTKVKEIRQ